MREDAEKCRAVRHVLRGTIVPVEHRSHSWSGVFWADGTTLRCSSVRNRRKGVMQATSQRIGALTERLLDHVRDHEPVEATRMGLEGRDGDLPDLSLGALEARTRSLGDLEAAIRLERGALPPGRTGQVRELDADLDLLLDAVRWRRTELEVRPALSLDPSIAVGLATGGVLDLLRDDGPWTADGERDRDERRRRTAAAVHRARQVPTMLEQAGRLLTGVSAPTFALLEERLPGAIALMRDRLPAHAEAAGLEVDAARDAGEYAAEGLEAFAALVDELVDERRLDWRVGPEHIDRALRLAVGTTMDAQSIEDRARTTLHETRAEMVEIASAGWTRRFPGVARPGSDDELLRTVFDDIAATAVPAGQLLPEARRAVEEARTFLVDWGLLDLPPEDMLRVEPMPDDLRGVAVALLRRSPPLRPELPSAFHLSSIPTTWEPERSRSFLREYHPAMLRSLAVHEAYPGHFLQLAHAAKHPRLVRRLLGRPVFSEGWAVLMEEVVIDAGFGEDGSSRVPREDLVLTQRKMKLRTAANALLDMGLHAASMTDDDALALLTGAALQERVEAEGKLRRAKLTSGQLSSYYAGLTELKALQRRAKVDADHEGRTFDLGRFLRQLLSQGTPTVAIVADALADDAPELRPFLPEGAPGGVGTSAAGQGLAAGQGR